jgi:SnoaL-like domain
MRLAVAAVIAACAPPAASPAPPAQPFADVLVTAISAHDASAAAAQFAPDAEVSMIGGTMLHGRAAIAQGFDALFARFEHARVAIGRRWTSRDASVIELVFMAVRAGRPIGVVAGSIVTFDRAGLVATARVYVDVPTIVGQIDPSRLPEGAQTRPPVTSPPAGTIASTTTGTAAEAENLAAATASWDRLNAHDPAGVLAAAAPDYVYDDFAGPAPLDLAGTHALLERWLGLVPDFAIVARPIHFAAGDDVITESIEHMTFRGRAVTLQGLAVKHFAHGRVLREWQYANSAASLGALFGMAFEVP